MIDTTTADDIFSPLAGAVDRVQRRLGVYCHSGCRCCMSVIGTKAGIVINFMEKVKAANGGHRFVDFSLYVAPGSIVLQTLRMDHVMVIQSG